MTESIVSSLHLAARAGLLNVVKTLVEVEGQDINAVDEFDSVPLFYACLAGHMDVVRYLLQQGARCDAKTFVGERCFLAALTREVRHELRTAGATAAARLPLVARLEDMLLTSRFTDVVFDVHGELMAAHRAVVCARAPLLAPRLLPGGAWGAGGVVRLRRPELHADAFRVLLRLLYTGRLEAPRQLLPHLRPVLRGAGLEAVGAAVEAAAGKGTGGRVAVVDERHRHDLMALAREVQSSFHPTADLCVRVGERTYAVHRCFMMQAPFFSTMLASGFAEGAAARGGGDGDGGAGGELQTVVVHDTSAACFEAVLEFLYSHTVTNLGVCRLRCGGGTGGGGENDGGDNAAERGAEQVDEAEMDLAVEVLRAADFFQLPALGSLCGGVLAKLTCLDPSILFTSFSLARAHRLPKLEETAYQVMAEYLDDVVKAPEFREIVLADAMNIRERQTTDSLPIVDDIRVHIRQRYDSVPPMGPEGAEWDCAELFASEADRRDSVLNTFIESLGLDG